MHSIEMSENGRIVIPAAIRAALGLTPRSTLYTELRDGGLFLSTTARRNTQRSAYFNKMLSAPASRIASEELIAERRREA